MSEIDEETIARAIYQQRNGFGALAWSRRDEAHKKPYIMDARPVLALVHPAIERARVEGFNEGVDRVCTPRTWSIDMDHAWHRATPDVRKAFADLAAAIRKG
jgi:hypothetical protein